MTVKEFLLLKSKIKQSTDDLYKYKVTDKIKSCITVFGKAISEDGIQAATKFIAKKNDLEKQLAKLKEGLEEVSNNDGIFVKAWNSICNAFLKFVYNGFRKKMEKAYEEPQHKNNSQEPNNEIRIKINEASNSFLNSVSESESELTPDMQLNSKEQNK